jgi:Fe-S-cluster containining protein
MCDSARTEEAPASVCIGCGLCCDGTLLRYLAVSDESDLGMPLRAFGVTLITAADPPVFELPCPAVDQGTCTIHSLHRPRACAQFECALSQSVHDGRTDPEAAREVIRSAIGIRTDVRAGRRPPADLDRHLDQYFRGTVS